MPITEIRVQRFSLVSSKSFEGILKKFDEVIGHPDMNTFSWEVGSATSYRDMEEVIQKAIGTSGLMEFARFDIGEILRKESGAETPHIVRLVVGNPLIMKQMAVHVPDAASYAPVTILVDERPDGVHLSYDRMASFLASYENAQALKVARDLDAKVETLLTAATAE